MEWTDEAIVLSARAHGESSAIATLMTADHGRHAGYVKGGRSKRYRGLLQPGNLVQVRWTARLASQLGNFTLELEHDHAASLMDDPVRLAALKSACSLVDATSADRDIDRPLFHGMKALIQTLSMDAWQAAYVFWEINLLEALGFALELDQCAASGVRDHLIYVSPKSGRAVSARAGEPYKYKLLPLPGFLTGDPNYTVDDILDGLEMTGHFLKYHVFNAIGKPTPKTRKRFIDRLSKLSHTNEQNQKIA
jgi:DNA repair protein RecO (recombination protein O)